MTHPFPLPELARDLPSDFREEDSVFNERVQSKFAGVQKEAEIISELQKQGFTVAERVNEAGRRQAVLKGSRFVCNLRWEVSWLVDEDGMISDIRGKYGEAGCL